MPIFERIAPRSSVVVRQPSQAASGFTLLEMLVALVVFALIAAVTYATVVPAGRGFQMLQQVRDSVEQSYHLDRRLRMDVDYLTPSADTAVETLKISHDQRSGQSMDQLWLLVSEVSSPALVAVHYFVDEDRGMLVRESAMPWRRASTLSQHSPVHWDIGKVTSFQVQAMGENRHWVDVWDAKKSRTLPRALRVRWRDDHGERTLLLPLFIVRQLASPSPA
ncbi:MAG: prepilin-type N-terminal cleavage/methylation domain-containing protein [Mariprofundales bacterium]|nr:prepilin-type N-terminal cleavage/methylation domain-containing protein [Mariprofundales bacterium]